LFMMPEEGDEALVAFHDGKFDSPYVVGFLWNGKQVAPENAADQRVIVTPGGHQLRFEDKENDTRVILKSKGGHTITLEDKDPKKLEIASTASKITLDDGATPKVTISAGSAGTVSITLDSAGTITISTGAATVDIGTSGITVTSPAALTVNAPGAVTVNAS